MTPLSVPLTPIACSKIVTMTKENSKNDYLKYAAGATVTAAATILNHLLAQFLSPVNLIMIYLLGVVIVAIKFGQGPSILSSVLSVAAYDFFFVHPFFTFAVSDTQYLLTFAMMLAVALLISSLTTLVREHAEAVDDAAMQIETERLRSALLSSISHDLRTPLATITGASTSLLQGDTSSESAKELIQIVYEEAERMNRLVTNLLEMTRLETGKLIVNKEWQAIEEVIGTALSGFENKPCGRQIKVSIPEDLLLVPLDAVLIGQVLNNLLDNAIKYGGEEGEIELTAAVENQSVKICVLDRGPGIDAAESKQIFDKFVRGNASRNAAGVGLGLAICEGIVKAHHGAISAGTRPGGGAQVCFSLPLDTVPPQIEAES